MKNIILLTILILVPFFTYAQKAKIITSEREVVTTISAIGSDELFTESGNFKFSSILKIIFEQDTDQTRYAAEKLKKAFPIEFGNGTDLGKIDGKIIEANPNSLLSTSGEDSGDYLIKASKSGLISIGIGVAAGVATVVTGGTIPAIAAIGGVGSFGFLIDAWSKIGKAGKARKKELKTEKAG
jgi:hypothetical protein